MRAGAIGMAPGENKERDLSWQDWTVPVSYTHLDVYKRQL